MSFRLALAATAAALACLASAQALAADPPHGDFSMIDPKWGAVQIDQSFRGGEMGPAWTALKAAFPADYDRMTLDISTAVIQNRDWSGISAAFMQSHLADQMANAQHAPPGAQAAYQREKAGLLEYLSHANVDACALLGTGAGDPNVLGALTGEQMKRYSVLIAATVQAIDAGRKAPATYGALTQEDAAKIKAILVSQGASAADIQAVLSGNVGPSPGDRCRVGVVRNKALAAAPEAVIAKAAFR